MLDFIKSKARWITSLTIPTLGTQDEQERLLRSEDNIDSLVTDEPVDNCNIVYWIFFLYGVAMLLPWNVFITASEYFAARFSGSYYEETFQSYFSTYFTITNMAIFIYILWRQSSSNAIKVDVMYPVVLNTIVFGVMAITVETALGGTDYFWMTLMLLVLTGATTSFFQVAVFAEASRFPPQYVQAVMSGQGIAGVAVAVSSLLSAFAGTTKLETGDPSTNRSAFIYFVSALLTTVAALVGRVMLSQQPFYIYQMKLDKAMNSEQGLDDDYNNDDDDELSTAEQQQERHTPRPLLQLVKKSFGLIIAVAYIFVITLMMFPTITSLIKSVVRHPPSSSPVDSAISVTETDDDSSSNGSRFFDDDIFVAMHFLLFNVGDWAGRIFPLWPTFRTFNPTLLVILSGLRTIFVPLFLVCNVVVSTERNLPVLVNSDVLYFVLIWIFSVSNGWISSLTMMAAPQQPYLRSAAEKSQIGSVMSFSLVVGLAIGGCLSFWARSMV